MTKREMMVKAHSMAKQMVGNYSARLAIALRQLWALLKKGAEIVVKCMIRNCEIFVNKETRKITGSTYGCKDVLSKRFNCKWDKVSSAWMIPAKTKEEIHYKMMDKMDHVIEEYAI